MQRRTCEIRADIFTSAGAMACSLIRATLANPQSLDLHIFRPAVRSAGSAELQTVGQSRGTLFCHLPRRGASAFGRFQSSALEASMRILGALFIIGGVLLCLTLFFMVPGALMVGAGALLIIAAGNERAAQLFHVRGSFFVGLGLFAAMIVCALWLNGTFDGKPVQSNPSSVSQQPATSPAKAKKRHPIPVSPGQ
jgi:hypothetical protein